jgi:hypothetical protein
MLEFARWCSILKTAQAQGSPYRDTPREIHWHIVNPNRFRRFLVIAAGAAFYCFFVASVHDGLRSGFSGDDLMNLHHYWSQSAWPLVKANILFFSDYYRPGGGLFYLPIYSLFGYNPFPFRVVAFALVSCNLWLLYRIVASLTGSPAGGLLALALSGMHAGFIMLYFDSGMIYDVLAFFFYCAAFLLHISGREHGSALSRPRTGLIVALAVLAMNSKEIALSFPAAVGLFELVWHPPKRWSFRTLWQWAISGERRVLLLAGLVAAISASGKIFAPGALVNQGGYRPQFSLWMYLDTYANYLRQMFYLEGHLGPKSVLMGLSAMLVFALLVRRKELVWAASFNIVSFLPIAFITARAGFAFYLPALGWTVYLAGAILLAAREAARLARAGDRGGDVLAGAAVALSFLALFPFHWHMLQYPMSSIHRVHDRNGRYYSQLMNAIPNPAPGSRFLIAGDPYPEMGYDLYFLVRLAYGDRNMHVDRARQDVSKGKTFHPEDYDYVLDYSDGRVILTGGKAAGR